MARYTISDLAAWKKSGRRWAMLTAYDSTFARIFDQAGVPVLLVGDSAGNNFLGEENTIPVTVDELIPLARAVVRGSTRALVIADLPFGSYEMGSEQALLTAVRFMKESGVQGVKLEGGRRVSAQIETLVSAGIPVVGHLGLTPQSVHALGGFKVQGRGDSAEILMEDARALERSGVCAIVLELIPAELAEQITKELSIPIIGIGAGAHCDAQVLVWNDLLGLTPKPPKFARSYRNLTEVVSTAVQEWIHDVEVGAFPSESESFH
jgi:3-methyl-2-oxobutanoate hydroxymethyltransferase